jgi:hypothetical protein
MARRDLYQPCSWIMVRGCGKAGRFLDRIEKACDWSALEALRLRRSLSVRCPNQ